MILYHVTSSESAAAIKRDGFRDTGGEHHGVWLSDRPLDASEGAPYTASRSIFLCPWRTWINTNGKRKVGAIASG